MIRVTVKTTRAAGCTQVTILRPCMEKKQLLTLHNEGWDKHGFSDDRLEGQTQIK